jgi:hypothetical protein
MHPEGIVWQNNFELHPEKELSRVPIRQNLVPGTRIIKLPNYLSQNSSSLLS